MIGGQCYKYIVPPLKGKLSNMVFSSVTFLCAFMPVVLLLHTVIHNQRARNVILLIASLVFYAWGEPIWIAAMLFSTLINYACARYIDFQIDSKRRKTALALGVIISLAALFYFKYAAFLINNICSLLRVNYVMPKPKLPIGISFYTFQIITYTVDVYRKKAPVQKNPFRLLLYVCLFPQLIAGPIVRYGDIAEELEYRKVTIQGIGEGFFRFSLGLGKKVLLANISGEILNSLPIGMDGSFLSAWVGAVLFSFQLYFDFSGYSDMAIGLGRMLGFHFLENFDAPFVSKSISEFWRRWHISLGTFFREYVYIPLGGNRVSLPRWILNTMIVWGLTGIWHGANWNFLIWGLYFGALIILERTLLRNVLEKIPNWIKHAGTVILAVIGFVMFRFESFFQMGEQLYEMFVPWKTALSDAYVIYALKHNILFLLICIVCCFPIRKTIVKLFNNRKKQGYKNILRSYLKAFLAVTIICLSILFLVGQSFNPFLYFRF